MNIDTVSVDSLITIIYKTKSYKKNEQGTKPHIREGSLSLIDAMNFVKNPANSNAVILPTSNQPVNADAIIQRTPGDTGSKYDVGYTAGTSLVHYREANRELAMNNIYSIIGEVILGILLFVVLMFLIRFAIRKKALIKKFFS